jgi:hypothetical protein
MGPLLINNIIQIIPLGCIKHENINLAVATAGGKYFKGPAKSKPFAG